MPKNGNNIKFKKLPIEIKERIAALVSLIPSAKVATASTLFSGMARMNFQNLLVNLAKASNIDIASLTTRFNLLHKELKIAIVKGYQSFEMAEKINLIYEKPLQQRKDELTVAQQDALKTLANDVQKTLKTNVMMTLHGLIALHEQLIPIEQLVNISYQNLRVILFDYGKKGIELLRKKLISPEQLANITHERLSYIVREDLLNDHTVTAKQAIEITNCFELLSMLDRKKLKIIFEKNLLTITQINEMPAEHLDILFSYGFYALENQLITPDQVRAIPEDNLYLLFYKDCELLKKGIIRPEDAKDLTLDQMQDLITQAETISIKAPRLK